MKRLLAILLLTLPLCADQLVELVPPTLTDATILDTVCCTRPMRDGMFNISTSQTDDKFLVHCYGMGGSGWTSLFGSVGRAIALFEEQCPDKGLPIRVIGGGCMGLQSAISLAERGYNVVGITAEELHDLPSWTAAGYFALVSVQTSPEEQANLDAIGVDTFLAYQSIGEGTHPYFSPDCVRYLPVYCSEKTDSGLENLEAQGLIPPREEVTVHFAGGATHPHFLRFMSYFMDTTKLMTEMHQRVQELGIPITVARVESFDDVEEPVIFNCSGLGAKFLNSDPQMIAVRGHMLYLNRAAGTEHLNYMIYTKVEGGEYVYMFPKANAVCSRFQEGRGCRACIGGTFIQHTDALSPEEIEELDEREFGHLIDRTQAFFYGE